MAAGAFKCTRAVANWQRAFSEFSSVQRSALSINAFHACVYMYTEQLSSFRVLTLWFIDLTVAALPYSIHFSEFIPVSFTRKQAKHKNTQSLPFSYDAKMAANGY